MTYTNRFIALSCVAASVFATSCVNEFEEGQAPVSGEGYYISLTGDVNEGGTESRAHWDINTDNQSLAFTWDQSTDEMKSFVWRSNAFVDFDGGQKYSATTVTPDAENKKQAQLQITTGLSREYAQGDIIWAVSPLEDNNIDAENKVTFTLPDGFTHNSANIEFKVLPAIYRFKITNTESEDLTVNEVSISGPFCDKAELSMGNDGTVTPTYSVSNNGTYAIKVTTPAEGLKVAANTTAYLYALVFPTKTASKEDQITLSFKGKYGDTPVEGYEKTAKCSDIYKYDLDPNTYYDMEVPVNKTAGGDTEKSVITLFEGEHKISGWSVKEISDFYVHNLKEGDVLTVYFKDCESGTKSFKVNPWEPLGDGADGQIDENEKKQGFFTYTITSESAEKLKKLNLLLTGDGYTITKITLTTLLKCDPVSDKAIMISDFEGHNDNSSTTGVTLEYSKENGNTYLRFASSSVPSSDPIYLFNCSHCSANVSDIENYVIKFDLKIEEGVTGASQAYMQYILADNWIGLCYDFIPETTYGKWITVSRNISDISNLKGELSFEKGEGQGNKNNSLFGTNIPTGICIDNFRLEPKN